MKSLTQVNKPLKKKSLLSWERGLKSLTQVNKPLKKKSLLSWERGLKSLTQVNKPLKKNVAPLVGAWIEIPSLIASGATEIPSLLSWERGLKFEYLNADCYGQ